MPNAQQFRNWVNNNTQVFNVAPNLVTPAPKSRAVRFRWFNVGPISGHMFTLGANIHPDGGGALGGMWLAGNGIQGVELHPHANPTIPQQGLILGSLLVHLAAFFGTGNHQYDYENEVHAADLMMLEL